MKLAVIGKDVSKSDSPQMHTFILGKMGKTCTYARVSIPPADFSLHAEELFGRYDGFNVTIPFKGQILPYLRELKGDARTFGAVNTVVTKERAGYNTDGYGFLLMLENAGLSVGGKSVLVLGAGGAGRSCIKKLAEGGARVSAYERDEERLAVVYRELGGFTPLTEIPLVPYDIVVNCTGVGMHDTVGKTPVANFGKRGEEPVGEQLLSLAGAAVDLIYTPAESEFLRIAKACKKPTVSGGAMLFYQAYYADCIFTGRTPHAEEARAFYRSYREEL